MKVEFESITWANMLSTGCNAITVDLNKNKTVLIIGQNGAGKCLERNTKIDVCINNPETEQKFLRFMNDKNNKDKKR